MFDFFAANRHRFAVNDVNILDKGTWKKLHPFSPSNAFITQRYLNSYKRSAHGFFVFPSGFESTVSKISEITGNESTLILHSQGTKLKLHCDIIHAYGLLGGTKSWRSVLNFQQYYDRHVTPKGWTSLHYTIFFGNSDLTTDIISTKCLKDKCRDIFFKSTPHNWTPLHLATITENAETVRRFVEMDEIYLHQVTDDGWSPLHLAIFYFYRGIFDYFMEKMTLGLLNLATNDTAGFGGNEKQHLYGGYDFVDFTHVFSRNKR